MLTPEQENIIRETILARLQVPEPEARLFLEKCNAYGLNPLVGEIYISARWNGKDRRNDFVTEATIDGLRVIASRSGCSNGQEGPFWCGPDGVWKDVWLSADLPAAAKVSVFRQGETHPYTGVATFQEFAQYFNDKQSGSKNLNRTWQAMPAHMIAKCAESLALRKAFPDFLGSLYTTEEMNGDDVIHARATEVKQLPAPPPPAPPQAESHEDFVDGTTSRMMESPAAAPEPNTYHLYKAAEAYFWKKFVKDDVADLATDYAAHQEELADSCRDLDHVNAGRLRCVHRLAFLTALLRKCKHDGDFQEVEEMVREDKILPVSGKNKLYETSQEMQAAMRVSMEPEEAGV